MALIRIVSSNEVHARKVRELGLDPETLDLTSPEALASALRRAASFLCPCAAPTLIRAILGPLRGLVGDLEAVKETVEATLEALVAHGDLLEDRDITAEGGAHGRVVLYAAPPSFVRRQSGAALLIGITPDQLSPLPEELEVRIEYVKHIRRLPADAVGDLRAELTQLGLLELSYDVWLKSPASETPAQHIARLDQLLAEAPPSHEVPELTLLDASRPVDYYRGRWVGPRSQSGRFVARRPQAYGADLWCYVEMRNGGPDRFIDLPLPGSRSRGCDEAWRLQMAIDAQLGKPQGFRVRSGPSRTRILDFFSPVPMWARRRWDAVGEPVASSACLFSYRFTDDEIGEELEFARSRLWLAELNDRSQRAP